MSNIAKDMRKKTVILILALAGLAFGTLAQEVNKVVVDPKLNREVLSGYCNLQGLMKSEMGETFQEVYNEYIPDPAVIDSLKPLMKRVGVLVILGTWCSDSQEQVPGLLKILDQLGYKDKNLTMICVGRDKKAEEIDLSPLNIERVPTVIFYRKGSEAGRIIETPRETLEKDMLHILMQ